MGLGLGLRNQCQPFRTRFASQALAGLFRARSTKIKLIQVMGKPQSPPNCVIGKDPQVSILGLGAEELLTPGNGACGNHSDTLRVASLGLQEEQVLLRSQAGLFRVRFCPSDRGLVLRVWVRLFGARLHPSGLGLAIWDQVGKKEKKKRQRKQNSKQN